MKQYKTMEYFLSVLGLVFIIEGLPYFVFPEKMKDVLAKIPLVPAAALRAFGITAILVGIMLVFIARRVLE